MNVIKILNRYIIWHLFQATIVVSVIQIGIVFLTQSIRFLELVVETGASTGAFWFLTLLALPRFFEVVVPIAVMISVLFIYHRLLVDSELVVMKSAGLSSLQLARPALYFMGCVTMFLLIMSFWAGPKSASAMQHYRQVIKANATQLFFREGVFNTIGDGLMFYIRKKGEEGELRGLMIHDSRESPDRLPVTILAERGVLVSEPGGNRQVVVYDGQRQQFNPETGVLDRLAFERYTVEIPEQQKDVRQRWAEPEERTFFELVFPEDLSKVEYERHGKAFIAEANRRITGPLLTLCLGSIALAFLLLGPMTRQGYARRIIAAARCGLLVQSLYLVSFDFAKKNLFGNALMYFIVLGPVILAFLSLAHYNSMILARSHKKENDPPPSQDPVTRESS